MNGIAIPLCPCFLVFIKIGAIYQWNSDVMMLDVINYYNQLSIDIDSLLSMRLTFPIAIPNAIKDHKFIQNKINLQMKLLKQKKHKYKCKFNSRD